MHAPVLLTVLCLAATATAEPPRELRFDPRVDVPVALASSALWISSELLKPKLAAEPCRWCDRDLEGRDTLNPLDRAVRKGLLWSNPDAGDVASSVIGFAIAPVGVLGLNAYAAYASGTNRFVLVDALLVIEAVTIAANLNQLVKFSVGRERPFVHALDGPAKLSTRHPADNNTSFYSGHANLAFALASAGGMVASLRGYRLAPVVWIVGMTLAVLTGYLRIAGDRHYLTDVVVGAAAGTLAGAGVVWLFHRPSSNVATTSSALSAPSLSAAPAGLGLSAAWSW